MDKANYFKSLRKALLVLKCFNPDEVELSGTEISRRVGIHRTSAYRILNVLIEEGFIEKNERAGKYTLGRALYALGGLYLSSKDILRAARPVFTTLNELTSEVVSMAVLDNGNAVSVLREESKQPIRYSHRIGQTFPAYATAMGRALLSEFTNEEIDGLYPEEKLQKLTPKTVDNRTDLKLLLEEIRKTGVSFNIEGSIEGLEGIASLVHDSNGKAVGAVSFAVPAFRMNKVRRTQFATLIKMAANLISFRIGYQNHPNPVHSIQEIESWWKENQAQ
jgi:DNA-binding IclR family transcriptional regulator